MNLIFRIFHGPTKLHLILSKRKISCKEIWRQHIFVKLQFKLNSPVQVGPGVDFVFPLSQQEEQQPPTKIYQNQAYYEAEILYVDLTHKYKMIQGGKTKLNPIPQGGGT